MKKLLIALLCIALIGGCVFMMISAVSAKKYAHDELESCEVSTGGGMLGGSSSVRLSKGEDGSVVLLVREKETHADREITTVYQASEAALAHVRELVNDYDLYRASKRPLSKMRALDADTTSIWFDFASGYFRVSEEQVLSSKMRDGFRHVADYLSSLAVGEGVTTKEAQRAVLYLKSGYTLQFVVEDAFDSKLDSILNEEHETAKFKDCGIVLCKGETPDTSAAEPVGSAKAGDIVFSPEDERILVLYADTTFESPVYVLARLDGYVSSACPLIAEMQGEYRLHLNQ